MNPHNFHPIFTTEQLRHSLRATELEEVCLKASHILDEDSLHQEIRASLSSDPEAIKGLEKAKDRSSDRWSVSDSGLLLLDNRIYVPRPEGNSDSLRIQVLRNHHDHILAGHFGQNKTLEIIRRQYVWPELRQFVRSWCQSCITCKRNKAPHHKPFSLLKPLPVPD